MEYERDFALPHFRDYWFIMIRRRKVIIISVLLLILLGLFSTNRGEPRYKARAKIIVGTGERFQASADKKTAGIYDYRESGEKYDNEYEIMRSSIVAKKTAEILGLKDKGAVEYIRGAVEINPVISGYQSTNVAFIVASDTDPKRAMDIVNYTIKAYLETKENAAREKIQKAYEIFAEQIQNLKNKIRYGEIALDRYKDKHNLEGIENELDKRRSELMKLLDVYTEKHPLVVQKRAQIEELSNRLLGDLPPDSDIGQMKSEYYALQQEVSSNKDLYDYLISSVKEMNVSEEMSKLVELNVLEWATLPTTPERKQNIILFFAPFVGLFLGIGLSFFLEYMDNSIKTEQDIKQYVGLCAIGIIPRIEEDA